MDSKLFETIVDHAKKSDGPKLVPYKRTDNYAVLSSDGEVILIPGEVGNRAHQAYDIATVANFATRFSQGLPIEMKDEAKTGVGTSKAILDPVGIKIVEPGACWYSRSRVTLHLDDSTRYDRVLMQLEPSQQMAKLIALEKSKDAITQADLRNMLKSTFKGNTPEGLVEVISKVKWTQNGTAGGDLGRGKASLGREITSQLEDAVRVPEYPVFTVPVFAGRFDVLASVECYLDVLPQQEMFKFYPLPGRMEQAWAYAEEKLRVALSEALPDGFNLYYGEP